MQHATGLKNMPLLGVRDEVKFVIGSEEDYAWAKAQVLKLRAPG